MQMLIESIARRRARGIHHLLATDIFVAFFRPKIRIIHIEGEHQTVMVKMIRRRIIQQRNGLFSRSEQLGDVGFIRIGRFLPQCDHRPVRDAQRNLLRGFRRLADGHQGQYQ